MLDELLHVDNIDEQDQKLLWQYSMLHRELNSFELEKFIEIYERYLGYGRE